MKYKEITRYQASWGAWYVQVLLSDGRRMELKFKYKPKEEDVQKVVDGLSPYEEPLLAPVLVELTVDTAIDYLKERLVTSELIEVTKITKFITDNGVILPVEPIDIKAVR